MKRNNRLAFVAIVFVVLTVFATRPMSSGAHPDDDLQAAGWNAPDGKSATFVRLPHTGFVPLQCAGVPFKMDHSMKAIAHTDRSIPEIDVNPHKLLKKPLFIQVFILAHECGHAYFDTDDEGVADCYAALRGIEQGWMRPVDFQVSYDDFARMAGDYDHRPGLSRWIAVVRNVELKTQTGKKSVQCDKS